MLVLLVAAAASSFNLNCAGTSSIFSLGATPKVEPIKERVSIVYQVDLRSGLWCRGNCAATSRIIAADDSTITFHKEKDEAGDEVIMVNRRTGKLFDRTRLFLEPGMFITLVEATCEPSGFTGFPAKKF